MAAIGLGRGIDHTLCVLLLNILARVVFAKNKQVDIADTVFPSP